MFENSEQWLSELVLDETTQYREVEIFQSGQRRRGFGKISSDKRTMTLIFHDHKNKWSMTKEPISSSVLYRTKPIPKSVFDYVVNQNLSNL